MSGLLDDLLAQPLDRSEQNRLRARDRLRAIGLPDARHEGWRYSTRGRIGGTRCLGADVAEIEVPDLPET